jgi:hypothetical protein
VTITDAATATATWWAELIDHTQATPAQIEAVTARLEAHLVTALTRDPDGDHKLDLRNDWCDGNPLLDILKNTDVPVSCLSASPEPRTTTTAIQVAGTSIPAARFDTIWADYTADPVICGYGTTRNDQRVICPLHRYHAGEHGGPGGIHWTTSHATRCINCAHDLREHRLPGWHTCKAYEPTPFACRECETVHPKRSLGCPCPEHNHIPTETPYLLKYEESAAHSDVPPVPCMNESADYICIGDVILYLAGGQWLSARYWHVKGRPRFMALDGGPAVRPDRILYGDGRWMWVREGAI